MRKTLAAVMLLVVLLPAVSRAETNLPLVCTSTASSCAQADRVFVYPKADSRVYQNGTLVQFHAATQVLVCRADVPVGTNTTGCPSSDKVTVPKSQVRIGPTAPEVEQPTGTGEIVLSWTPPTKNTDGSDLTDLTGYKIHYGTSPSSLTQTIALPNPSLTTHTLRLAPATWHLAVTAVSPGGESDRSNVVTKTIAAAPTCTTPKPAEESRTNQCVAPAVGSWTQTRTYLAASYPTCWTAGDWLPPNAPEGACVTPPPAEWFVAPVVGDTRPVYEPVLDAAGTATVRGTVQGRIDAGKPCGPERFVVGRNSYRTVSESDVTLDSPTYKGREHVAICAR